MAKSKFRKNRGIVLAYVFLSLLGIVMVYPLVWMFFSSFKTNAEIFGSISLLPKQWVTTAFVMGWSSVGRYTFTTFYKNSFMITIPVVILTVFSCMLTAFGLTRFRFRFKKLFTAVVIGTILLPHSVLIIPRYLLYNRFNWINTFNPFIIPAACATSSFHVFMAMQFVRGIPMELDEAARIDGCNYWGIFWRIILPLSKPTMFTIGLFTFMSSWNNFMDSLIYLDSVSKYPISLGLRLCIDNSAYIEWNQILAMSTLSILIPIAIYFFAQKYFVEGISTTGLKG